MPKTIVIVGGGLVGSLAAVIFAKRGENVKLYEQRSDIRLVDKSQKAGRSINLALSVRGLAALKAAGIEAEVMELLTPMRGRMLHSPSGSSGSAVNTKHTFVPYGVFGEAINSIDRALLNEILLTEAEKYGARIQLFFEHSLESADLDAGSATFLQKATGKSVTVHGDLIIGADGAYSSVRRELMRKARLNFSQEYIEHGYMELSIPPTDSGDFRMASDCLHIWPRHSFMMIALPNKDKSFTCTVFMPFAKFEAIKTEADLVTFFNTEFPDAIELMGGKDALAAMFFANPVGPLVTVKCSPYHYKDKVVIVGDASHAMVPFYGQGMNCGFEDILVLDSLIYGVDANTKISADFLPAIAKHANTLEVALARYSDFRGTDAHAICDLALYNYFEMRSNVLSVGYRVRKYVEGLLHRLFPRLIIPLYTMVSFTQIPYARVLKKWKRQTYWLHVGTGVVSGALFATAAWSVWRSYPYILKHAAALQQSQPDLVPAPTQQTLTDQAMETVKMTAKSVKAINTKFIDGWRFAASSVASLFQKNSD